MIDDNKQPCLETLAVHAGVHPDPITGAIMTPIFQTSTYVQNAADIHAERGAPQPFYDYSRSGNPTRTALEESIAALEGATYGFSFASGLSATDTLLRLLQPGDHVVVGRDVYGGTFRLFESADGYQKFGIQFSWVDLRNLGAVEAAIQENTRLIWLETPTNPLIQLADIQAIAKLTPDSAWLAVDNTFATPILQRPLMLGADVVLHSVTKYLGGHSDAVGGALATNDEELAQRLRFMQNAAGAVSAPMDCFLTLRGIKTLAIRVERHCQNAMAVAQYLEQHPRVQLVYYPGLASHPQHALATRQMSGYGGMVSFIVEGTSEDAQEICRKTRIFALAESLGGVESLIEHPLSMTHASTADSEIAVPAGLIRLSVGIEHIEDLIRDLEKALG